MPFFLNHLKGYGCFICFILHSSVILLVINKNSMTE